MHSLLSESYRLRCLDAGNKLVDYIQILIPLHRG